MNCAWFTIHFSSKDLQKGLKMPKEFLYGSDKRISGYGLILASSTATPEEKKWVSENSVFGRIGSPEESPVSWSFSLAGKTGFLTRSCATVDPSGRPSFLANHLVLSQEETLLYEDGPVYVLSRYRFAPSSSDQAGLERNTRQILNRFDGLREEISRCGMWQSILSQFSHNGRSLAGAAAILILRGNPVYIVYGQNQSDEILPLFRELWSLFPVACRWKYTFNTYLANLGTAYSLNGLLKDGDKVAQFCQSGRAFYLDLSTGAHNFPGEILESSSLSGIERYLMTGNVTEAQENYEQTPDFPTPSSNLWEKETGLIRTLHEDFQKAEEELAAETTRMNSELASLKEANARYKSSADRMREELDSLETRVKEESEKNAQLQHTNENLTHRNSALKQEFDQVQNQFQVMTTRLNEAKKCFDELSEKSKSLAEEIQTHTKTKDELKMDILRSNSLKSQLLDENNRLTSQKEELQKEVDQFREEKSELENDLKTLRICSQKKALQKRFEDIRKSSEEVLAYIQILEQKK